MYRTLVIALSVMLLASPLSFGEHALGDDGVHTSGYLGEVVPWPLMPAGMRVISLDLGSSPLEELTGMARWIDDSEDIAFGLLPVGDGSDPGVTFLAILAEEPRLIVDTDNDESLGDEQGFLIPEPINARSYSWYFSVWPEYEGGQKVEYPVCVSAYYSYSEAAHAWGYSGFCQRRGLLDLQGQVYEAAITSLQSSGVYSDVAEIVIAIDSNRDGEINDLPGSCEVFGPGEPIQAQGQSFEIEHISADGRRIMFVPADSVAPRSLIARGERAPEFTATSTLGEEISFPMAGRDAAVIVFVPQISAPSCDPCAAPHPPTGEARLLAIVEAMSSFEEDVPVLVVTPTCSEPLSPAITKLDVTILCDRSIAELYRRVDGLLIVDSAGVIVAMDEAWRKHIGPRPAGSIDQLLLHEIEAVVAQLLGE